MKYRPLQEQIGKRYGKLHILAPFGKDKKSRTIIIAHCSCGNFWKGVLNGVLNGTTRSCGCMLNKNPRRGNTHPCWRGGRTIASTGYVRIKLPNHPRADTKGYVAEHALVMEQSIGRPIVLGETIHHKNGIRGDNRIENLELWVGNHTSGQRMNDYVEEIKALRLKIDQLVEENIKLRLEIAKYSLKVGVNVQ